MRVDENQAMAGVTENKEKGEARWRCQTKVRTTCKIDGIAIDGYCSSKREGGGEEFVRGKEKMWGK